MEYWNWWLVVGCKYKTDQNGRRPNSKMTKMEDDQKWKMTKMEDNRKWKMTKIEDDQE